MDLNDVKPDLNLYNREWPVRSTSYPDPPAKFVFDEDNRRGQAIDSIVAGGCIVSGGVVRKSVLGRGVHVHTGALVEGCVLMDNCHIGRRAKLRRAILDKNVRIPERHGWLRSGFRPCPGMARYRDWHSRHRTRTR